MIVCFFPFAFQKVEEALVKDFDGAEKWIILEDKDEDESFI